MLKEELRKQNDRLQELLARCQELVSRNNDILMLLDAEFSPNRE